MDYLFRFNQLRSNNRSTLGHYCQVMYPQQDILVSDLVQLNVNQNNKYRHIIQDTEVRSRRLHEPPEMEILERAFCRHDALE